MPVEPIYYLGVQKAELGQSIINALLLLENHPIGPECQKRIEKFYEVDPATGKSPFAAIVAAKDDVALAAAVNASGMNWLFARVGEVLEYHAVNDTDGKGLDIVTGLDKWDARGGVRTMDYSKVDEECDTWLMLNMAKEPLLITDPLLERLQKITDKLTAQGEGVIAAKVLHTVKILFNRSHGSDGVVAQDEDLKSIFLALDLRERHIAKEYMEAMTPPPGIRQQARGATEYPAAETPKDVRRSRVIETPFGSYGVVLDNLQDPAVTPLAEKVDQVLKPFLATNEVQMMGIGFIGKEITPTAPKGIMFVCTFKAAQAVADALPGQKVIDGITGKVIRVQKPKKAPKPGFGI